MILTNQHWFSKATFLKHRVVIIIMIVFFIFTYGYRYCCLPGVVDMLSISSDGRYVISTDEKEHAILWDLQHKTYKIVGRHTHVFSAYFIPDSDQYLWQDQHKVIHIQTISGEKIRSFKAPIFIYGIALTKNSDDWWAGSIEGNLYSCHGSDCHSHCYIDGQFPGNKNGLYCNDTPDTLSNDKAINLSFTPDHNQVLSSNYHHAILWDVHTKKEIESYDGNIGKTFSTLSPDGKYIVSGDEQPNSFVWIAMPNKELFRVYDIFFGKMLANKDAKIGWFDESVLNILPPKDFFNRDEDSRHNDAGILALKFIDKDHYLRFTLSIPYTILYNITDPQPLKYFPLGRNPWPAIENYALDQALDTSPTAHVLVIAKANRSGILVYHYDTDKQTLTKVWDAS